MIHVAIMKKSWGMVPKIISGEKTIESRWYKTKRTPWDKVKIGDEVYFKNTGEPVSARAIVTKVRQFSDLTPGKVRAILAKYGLRLGVDLSFYDKVKDKNYCILVFLQKPQEIEPFNISKKGFGAMASWFTGPSLQPFRSS